MRAQHLLSAIAILLSVIAPISLTAMSRDESKLMCAALNKEPIAQYFEDNYEFSTQALNQTFYYATQAGNTLALTTLMNHAIDQISSKTITRAFHTLIENNNISEQDIINVLRYFFAQPSICDNISHNDMREALKQALKNNKFCIAFCLSGMLAQNIQDSD
ncbi:MAG: hypothetical protein WCW33_01180 [Candidatus Babeliales bacterium]|jgi:hypothetical protein